MSAKSDGWHMPQSTEYGPLALLYLVACMLMGYGNMVSFWRWFVRKWFRRDSTSIGRGKR